MNVIKAAQDTIDFAHKDKCSIKIKPHRHKYGIGYNHAVWMLEEIVSGNVQNDKANRWLGYAQALLVNFITLEKLRNINDQ